MMHRPSTVVVAFFHINVTVWILRCTVQVLHAWEVSLTTEWWTSKSLANFCIPQDKMPITGPAIISTVIVSRRRQHAARGMMFSSRTARRPLTLILRAPIPLYLVEGFTWNKLQYISCEQELLKRFSRSRSERDQMYFLVEGYHRRMAVRQLYMRQRHTNQQCWMVTVQWFCFWYDYTRPTQPSIPLGSVNEYHLRLGRQRQVWFIPLVDKRVVCR